MSRSSREPGGALESETERELPQHEARGLLHEALVEQVARVAHFVKQKNRIDGGSLRFDGRLLLTAAAALHRYERLANPRLHRRLGFEMPGWLRLTDQVKRQVQRALAACIDDLASLESMSRSKDLPAARRALRMDGAEQTPEQSAKRQRYRDLTTSVRLCVERRIDSMNAHLAGNGSPLPGETMSAIFAIVASSFSGASATTSPDTVRRAWMAGKASTPALQQLETTFQSLRERVRQGRRPASADGSASVARRHSQRDSPVKKSIDRALSKNR